MQMFSSLQHSFSLLASCLSFLPFTSFDMKVPPLSTTTLFASTTAAKIFDLSESNWTLTSPGNESFVGIEGKVPSQAHLDLYAAGVISDPYFGLNDFDLRWVAGSNWSYSTGVDGL
jgi:beta-mannosidase